MRIAAFASLCFGLTLLSSPFLQAQTSEAVTDPVGAINLNPLANSDTHFTLPLHRPAVFSGSVSSSTNNTITFSSSTGFSNNQLVYAAGTQPNTYYVLIESGSLEGRFFTITANSGNSITVDNQGVNLSTLESGAAAKIIPYWTFGTLFPSGQGVSGSNSHLNRNTEILVFSGQDIGINLSPSHTYYYFNGTNPGWRRQGGGMSTVRNDDIISPDTVLIYRQNDSVVNQFIHTGCVQMCGSSFNIRIAAGMRCDSLISTKIAAPISLAQSGLFQSGIFAGSTSHSLRADELLVFDNTSTAKNKSPVSTYYYFTGSNPGWRLLGGGLSTIRDNDIVFHPGHAYIIRKSPGSSNGQSTAFVLPQYLQ